MRLIDGDALMYEANSDGAYGYVDAKQISEAPTIDAVPVVRCWECKHGELVFLADNGTTHIECYKCIYPTMGLKIMEPDDFCSYGERKEGAD